MLRNLRRYLNRLVRRGPGAKLCGLSAADWGLVDRLRSMNLTYLSDARLASLCSTCRAIEQACLPGVFIEAGCALGGSTVLISTVKSHVRPLLVYDVFGMIPPPSDEDPQEVHERYRAIVTGVSKGIGGDKYYGYEANLRELVRANLQAFAVDCEAQSVSLIMGLLQDTMVIDQQVAFAHIDVDWYEPVMTCLQRILPRLVPGGSVILDDYHDWAGCRKAADEYLRGWPGHFCLDDSAGSMKITRVAS